MASSAAGWIRVANGFRLVAGAATEIIAKEGGSVASSATRHGVDLAKNARTAAKAAGVTTDIPQFPTHQHRSNVNANDVGHVNHHVNEFDMMKDGHSEQQTENFTIGHEGKTTAKPLHSSIEDTTDSFVKTSTDVETRQTNNHPSKGESLDKNHQVNVQTTKTIQNEEPTLLKEGRPVPSTRIGRAAGFASLGVGLAAGTIFEAASRIVSTVTNSSTSDSNSSIVANDANADRLAKTLCRMRGAALKLGQMMSIQDETLLPAPIARALEQVRQGADAMPLHQLYAQLEAEFGTQWREKFDTFEDLPFAAASIGQVHRATVSSGKNDDHDEKQVVVKVQYPGVANSIESDLSNLTMLVKMSGMAPPGLFIDRVIEVGREELKEECNYEREANNQERLRDLIHNDVDLARANFRVPAVLREHSTRNILTSEYCPGGTIDKVAFLDQEERNRIGRNIMRLTVKELFTWRFMQTDPNWGNFLYDVGSGTTHLIDFGSTREYSKSFVDGYLRIVWACANNDTQTLMDQSHKMGFLTGEENDIMLKAHELSGFTLGEPFATHGEYDFKNSGITGRISEHGSAFLQHRLTPPPEEVYTLHRKLAGAFNLCIKLEAKIQCRDLLEEVLEKHTFEDGQAHPLEA